MPKQVENIIPTQATFEFMRLHQKCVHEIVKLCPEASRREISEIVNRYALATQVLALATHVKP